MTLNEINTIEGNLKLLEPFVLDLNKYFSKGRILTLFKRLPLRDETENTTQRLLDGSYLLSPCGIELDKNECNSLALELIDILKLHLIDRADEIAAINNLLINEQIISHDIILKALKNEGNEIRKQISHSNLSEDLFTFYLVYLARPFREQAANFLTEKIDKLNWQYGYCPICGHWPELGHINSEGGERTLWCLCCNTKWKFKRTQCAFCLNENHEFIEIINPVNEESFRIQACKKCKRYLKEIRSNVEVKKFPFDKIYLGTIPLDIIAENQGYIQESILTVRYDNSNGNELLMYRQKATKEKIIFN